MTGSTKRVSVVTGGASGIGAACVRELAANGDLVIAVDRDLAKAQAVAAEIGGRAYAADVGDEQGVETCAAAIERECGPVDVLVNSAGIIQVPVRPHDLPMSAWDDVVRVDQRGTYVACLAFARGMIGRKRGSIVNIASIAGMRSMPLHAYAPAKAAVIAITECLAAEWGPSGVRVNAVCPGWVKTEMDVADQAGGGYNDADIEGVNPMGRFAKPEDIAQAILFLAEPERSGFVNGHTLVVDGGWTSDGSWQSLRMKKR